MKKILIVDDEINIGLLLSKFLTRNSFDVNSATSGSSAMEYLAKDEYDLVLCDYRLEDTDGREMLIKIDFESENPIYMQLKEQLIEGIARAELVPGENLPSVRQLAEDIGINLHTVSKTYNILKAEGYLTVDRRKGAVVNEIPHEEESKQYDLRSYLSVILAQMHCKGIKRESINQWIEEDFQGFSPKEAK